MELLKFWLLLLCAAASLRLSWTRSPASDPARCDSSQMPRGVGPCKRLMSTYTYNAKLDRCEEVVEVACSLQGRNRHLTRQHCELNCIRQKHQMRGRHLW